MEKDYNPDHDYEDPANEDTFLRAYKSMTDYETNPSCRYCAERRDVLAMSGVAWAWQGIHEGYCPEHEDNQESAVMHVVDHYGGPDHQEAEAILNASQEDDQ